MLIKIMWRLFSNIQSNKANLYSLTTIIDLISQTRHLLTINTSITLIAPKLGVGQAVLFIVISQIFSSAIIDHFGLFGLPVLPFNYKKLIGLICVIAGVILIKSN
jgi:uncharacterized membrane protein YGL010W